MGTRSALVDFTAFSLPPLPAESAGRLVVTDTCGDPRTPPSAGYAPDLRHAQHPILLLSRTVSFLRLGRGCVCAVCVHGVGG